MTNVPSKKKKHRKWPWLVLAALAAVAFFAFQSRDTGDAFFSQEAAQTRDIITYYRFSGNLTPVSDKTQTAKEQLKVKELYVSEGATVRKGDVLLRATDGTRVYAAYDGTLETLYAEVDDTLQPGSQLAHIVDYGTLEVTVDVDEYDIGAVALGKEARVYLNALDRTVPGVVTEIARDATTEGGVSYYEVKLQLDPGSDVRSGMSVEVSLLNQQALNVVSVSLDALSYDEYNRPYVYRKASDGGYTAVSVETGVSDGKNIEVRYGLSAGETVYYQSNDMARFFQMRTQMMGAE